MELDRWGYQLTGNYTGLLARAEEGFGERSTKKVMGEWERIKVMTLNLRIMVCLTRLTLLLAPDACPVGPVVKVGEDPDLSDDDISDAETKRSRKIASMSTKVLAQGSRTSANAGKPGIVNMDRSTILQGNFVPW